MKIGLCAGHCMQAPGAHNERTNINEQWLCRLVALAAGKHLPTVGVEVVDPKSDTIMYREQQESRSVPGKTYTPAQTTLFHRAGIYREEAPDLIIDIHMNIGSPNITQRAFSMIYDNASVIARAYGQEIANEVSWELCELGLHSADHGRVFTQAEIDPDRRIYLLGATRHPTIILEICDIGPHREADCLAIQADAFKFAVGVAAGITRGVKRVM